jgi:hypothetical protein
MVWYTSISDKGELDILATKPLLQRNIDKRFFDAEAAVAASYEPAS